MTKVKENIIFLQITSSYVFHPLRYTRLMLYITSFGPVWLRGNTRIVKRVPKLRVFFHFARRD
jgi:hypothetical protein